MRRLCILALFVVQACAGAPSLHDAARRGDEEQLKALLNGGADVDARDKNGCTPLHKAAGEGHLQAAKLLLNRSADVDARNDNGLTPLHEAAEKGHHQAAKLLLDRGAEVDARNKRGATPLHNAAWNGRLQTAKLLLDRGAHVDAREGMGWRPLHMAAAQGHMQVAKLLLDRGAEMEARNKRGATPLHNAAWNGRLQTAKLLLNRSADVDAREGMGWRPLHMAAYQGQVQVAKLLLQRGADRANRDNAGLMARDLAVPNWCKNRSAAKLMGRVLPPLTPQEKRAHFWSHSSYFWCFIVAAIFGVLVAVLWEKLDVAVKHKVYDALGLQLRSGDRAEGPSRGAIVLAADALVKNRRLAKAFRLAEVFVNMVVPMRVMFAFKPMVWLPALAVAYLLPEYLLTGSCLPQQPLAIVVASARQSLLADAGSWSKGTWAFLAIGAARSIIMVAIFWVATVNDTRDWWEPSQPWFKNVKGQEVVWLLNASDEEYKVGPPFDVQNTLRVNDEEYKAGLPFHQLTIPSVSQQWAWVNLGGLAVLAGWLIAVVFTLCLRRPTQAYRHRLLRSEPQKGVLDLAAEVDQACEEADGVTYEHLRKIDRNLKPFKPITRKPPGGLIFEVGMIFVDFALDMFSVSTMLLNEDVCFAGIMLIVSSVSSARQLARGALVKLYKDAKVMMKTGVRTEFFMELCAEESGAEAFVSLLVSAYALPFSVRTPVQMVLGCLSMASSVWHVAKLLHEHLDLEGLAAEERAEKERAEQAHLLLAANF